MPQISASTNIESIQLKEASAPDTPASGYGRLYAKTDGHIYFKNDAGTEVQLDVQTATPFGAAVSKTIASGVVSAGSDRHLRISAESGTSDDLIEITGLSVGEEVIIWAASGHTITVRHDNAGATEKIYTASGADETLENQITLKLVKLSSTALAGYI